MGAAVALLNRIQGMASGIQVAQNHPDTRAAEAARATLHEVGEGLRARLQIHQPFSFDYAAGTIRELGRLIEAATMLALAKQSPGTLQRNLPDGRLLGQIHDLDHLLDALPHLHFRHNETRDLMALSYHATTFGARTLRRQPGRSGPLAAFLAQAAAGNEMAALDRDYVTPSLELTFDVLAQALNTSNPKPKSKNKPRQLSPVARRLLGKELASSSCARRCQQRADYLLAQSHPPLVRDSLSHTLTALQRIQTKYAQDPLRDPYRSVIELLYMTHIAVKEACAAALAHNGVDVTRLGPGERRPLLHEHDVSVLMSLLQVEVPSLRRDSPPWLAKAHRYLSYTQVSKDGSSLSKLLIKIGKEARRAAHVRQNGDLRVQQGGWKRVGSNEETLDEWVETVRKNYIEPALELLERVLTKAF